MIKVLFMIHDLHHGGAEKVLINLVNNMDKNKFDITVLSLFGGGINEQFLSSHVRLIICHKRPIRGNSIIMKLFTPHMLYKHYVKEKYDFVVSYLEGPTARIVSGCTDNSVKLISWIHIEQHTKKIACQAFRNYKEALNCYGKFNGIVCVSEDVKKDFLNIFSLTNPVDVLYNTNETELIQNLGKEQVTDIVFNDNEIKLCGVGKILPNKGFDKLAKIHYRLRKEGYPIHTYILGEGKDRISIEEYINKVGCSESFTFLGYQINPYKYLSKCDVFVCSSNGEGFSTAATEAIILGIPVVTTKVSGMEELLGKNNECGIIANGIDEESLYMAIKKLIKDRKNLLHFKEQTKIRGKSFSKQNTVQAVENYLIKLSGENYD